nr:PREDICTED: starch-binding domain-containing protein 1 [Paralichthys olivaceus]
MPLKNGNSVGLERRMDLASLFCMIGRHGPAVALAVIAMASVLVGFIIYRNVRGKKRRKATAAAGDGDGESPGAQRDASGASPGDPLSSSVESTDGSDEVSSEMKDDADLSQRDLNLRHRRSPAAETKPSSYSPAESDEHARAPDSEAVTVVHDSYEEAEKCAEEATHNLTCDATTSAGMKVESATDDRVREDVNEGVHGNEGCWTEPVLIHDERHEEVEKVFEAEDQDDESETIDEEEHQVCFVQTLRMSGDDDDVEHRRQDNEATPETNGVEAGVNVPSIRIEDVSVCCVCYGKDEFEEENHHQDGIDDSNHSSYHFSPEEEKENVGEEAEEEFVDQQFVPQPDEICPSTCEQEPNQIEPKNKNNGLMNDQGNGVLPTVADEAREETRTSDDAVARGEEHDGSGVVLDSSLHRLNEPVQVDNHDDPSGINTNAETQISGVADSLESRSDCQQTQSEENEEETVKPLDKDTDLTVSGSDVPSLQEELCNLRKNIILAEKISQPQVLKIKKIFAATGAAVCDNETITTSAICEELSHPDTLALSQDQESHRMQNTSRDLNPPRWQPPLRSFEQSELRDQDEGSVWSPGFGAESGISSMTASPDLQDAGDEFGETIENMIFPQLDCDPQSEEGTETQNSLYVAVSVITEDTAGTMFGPYPSLLSHQPHSEQPDEAQDDSLADNEDTFGHEIEDSYHRALEQVMLQISATSVNTTEELRIQTDVKAVVEVVQIKEKKEDARAAKKMETEAETEKEDDYEKTEISIMEATMDNNEWITDSSYQVLPWMNITVPSFSQDHKNAVQPPTDAHSSSLTDVSCVDTDSAASADVKQTSTLAAADENTENNKKVVAVQPMPQNVNVTFRIHYLTHSPYQTVAVTGNQQELGNWKDFIPLEKAKDGQWATVVSLPAESHVEWKFVLVEKGEVCRWEECGNRLLDTGYGDELTVHKWWGLL